MPRLLIYNPESDYALASGSPYYTPPRSVVRMRAENALLPSTYARGDDAILVLDDIDVSQCNVRVLHPDDPIDWETYEADPWGWNHQIAHLLSVHCPGTRGIPSTEWLDALRSLSHRRTTISFLAEMPTPGIEPPIEFKSVQDAMVHYDSHPRLFVKAPWSSSGRGILFTPDISREQTEQWIRGAIRSQGSVMVESAYDRILDFATEWLIEDGIPHFLGVSVFRTSSRGKYHGNIHGTQAELWDMIPGMTSDIVVRQKEAIRRVIADRYHGPLGIDMLATTTGTIHPCVEINLRNTMGSILIRPDDRSLVAKFPSLF